MEKMEYTEANNNFRHFVTLEKDYLQIFTNSTTMLLAAFWLVSSIPALRYLIIFIGLFLSSGLLVTEMRYSTYFKHFFNIAMAIEKKRDGKQFTHIKKYFNRPFLGIRSTNVIISFYAFFFFCWCAILVLDIVNARWYEAILVQIRNSYQVLFK